VGQGKVGPHLHGKREIWSRNGGRVQLRMLASLLVDPGSQPREIRCSFASVFATHNMAPDDLSSIRIRLVQGAADDKCQLVILLYTHRLLECS
jgi:hypothetical protein